SDELIESSFLSIHSSRNTMPVVEHEHIGSGNIAAINALRHSSCSHRPKVYLYRLDSLPDVRTAWFLTLQVVYRAMRFYNLLLSKSGFLKLPIDIRSDNVGRLPSALDPITKDVETTMWFRLQIQLSSMTIEPPCK